MVDSYYQAATPEDPGMCINMIPHKSGTISIIEATTNAVIIQLFHNVDGNGDHIIDKAVCIECIDEDMLPALKAEALRILSK